MRATRLLFLFMAIALVGLFGCQSTETEYGETQTGEGSEYGRESGMQAELKIEEGQLVQVDPEARTLSLRKSDGTDMEFSFDDQTQVRGAEMTIQGLASKTNAHVTVHYEEGVLTNTAKMIEVHSSMGQESF